MTASEVTRPFKLIQLLMHLPLNADDPIADRVYASSCNVGKKCWGSRVIHLRRLYGGDVMRSESNQSGGKSVFPSSDALVRHQHWSTTPPRLIVVIIHIQMFLPQL